MVAWNSDPPWNFFCCYIFEETSGKKETKKEGDEKKAKEIQEIINCSPGPTTNLTIKAGLIACLTWLGFQDCARWTFL